MVVRQLYDVVASCRLGRHCRVHDRLWPWVRSPLVVSVLQPPYNYVVARSCIDVRSCRFGCRAVVTVRTQFLQILPATSKQPPATVSVADGRLYSRDCVSPAYTTMHTPNRTGL